jgi:TetR/AcrR family transcriptional regulator
VFADNVKTRVGRPSRKRLGAPERRQQLIETALCQFATNGFRGTTTRAIACAAGVSEAIIFRHFKTKEDLYGAILREKARKDGFDRALVRMRGHARRNDDRGLVKAIVMRVLEVYRRDPDFQRVLMYARLEGHALAKANQRSLSEPFHAFLREYVLKRQAAGALRARDPDVMVFALIGLPLYFAMVRHLFGIERVKRTDPQVAEAFTTLILHGIQAPAPKVSGTRGRKRPSPR